MRAVKATPVAGPLNFVLGTSQQAFLLAAPPICHFLEYVDWANELLQEPLVVTDGHALIPGRSG